MKILIKNIKSLLLVEEAGKLILKGEEMGQLNRIDNAWLAIEDGLILEYGKMEDSPGIDDWRDLEVIDAEGKYVMPAYCDSHSHIVFAGTRESEFVDRINGLSYEEIAARGGGILNSAKKLQETSEEALFQSALKRLNEVIQLGTGAIEIKSGYGLTIEAELKMLRVIKRLKEESPVSIKSTFLGAHAYPIEYKDDHEGYLNLVINEMLPVIAEEGLADYIDAFCETNYFSVDDTKRIIEAGKKHGLKAKIHVNQFTSIGGIQACIDGDAHSVDHLEILTEEDIEALTGSETLPVFLPSCSFFLSIPYGPARQLIDKGMAIALATDYNPGSTPSGNMQLVNAMACIKMKLTPEEAISATTLNGAYAMDLSDSLGSITKGKKANLIITKAISSFNFIPYSFGENHIDQVILNGKRVHQS